MYILVYNQVKQPPSDLQNKNDQLINEVEQLTEQITQLHSNQTSLSTENKYLQKQNEDLQEMLEQVPNKIMHMFFDSKMYVGVCVCSVCSKN